jgi:hypothetical protein
MMKPALIGFAFALAATGCADSTGNGKDTDGDGSGSDMQPQPDPEMDAQGVYRINSTFDIATNMPGATGDVLNTIIAATDDQDDPMSWVVDQIIAGMADGTLKDAIKAVKPFVIGYLNDRVTSLAPELFDTLVEIGQRLEDLTKKLGVNERLDITTVDQTFLGTSTADGVTFDIDGTKKDFLFVDHNIDNVIVPDILVTLDKTQAKMNIGAHDLPLPWGKIVRLGMDAAIIPAIDSTATSLTDLLDNVVNCQAVGAAIDDAIGFGGAAFWGSACLGGLGLAADKIYDQLAETDSTLGMNLTGVSRYQDNNADWKIDELKFGNWTGSMDMQGENAALAQPAAYVGKRMLLTP